MITRRRLALEPIFPNSGHVSNAPAERPISTDHQSIDLQGWFTLTESKVYRSLVNRIRSGIVVEVGVWKGRSISTILDVCRANQNRLFAVDTWAPNLCENGYPEAAEHDIAEIFRFFEFGIGVHELGNLSEQSDSPRSHGHS